MRHDPVNTEHQPEWARRMERKLDALIEALADEGEQDAPGIDLDGNQQYADRDTSQPL
jgi:hypothetical protein